MFKTIPDNLVADSYIRTWRKYSDALKTGKLTVYNYVPYEDEETGLTEFKFKPILYDVPYRLSNQDKESATENEPARAPKSIRITTPLDIIIPPGSVIELTVNGETCLYKCSGQSHINDPRKSYSFELYEEHAISELYEGTDERKNRY